MECKSDSFKRMSNATEAGEWILKNLNHIYCPNFLRSLNQSSTLKMCITHEFSCIVSPAKNVSIWSDLPADACFNRYLCCTFRLLSITNVTIPSKTTTSAIDPVIIPMLLDTLSFLLLLLITFKVIDCVAKRVFVLFVPAPKKNRLTLKWRNGKISLIFDFSKRFDLFS